MKKCGTCNKEYDDGKMFCPDCGKQLTSVTPEPAKATAPTWFENWGGILLALLGLIIAWEVYALVGFALAVVGIISGWSSPNQINKVLSIVVGAVTVILVIWYLLA